MNKSNGATMEEDPLTLPSVEGDTMEIDCTDAAMALPRSSLSCMQSGKPEAAGGTNAERSQHDLGDSDIPKVGRPSDQDSPTNVGMDGNLISVNNIRQPPGQCDPASPLPCSCPRRNHSDPPDNLPFPFA